MLLPPVFPLPNVSVEQLLTTLRRLLADESGRGLVNIQNGSVAEQLVAYQSWSSQAAESLGYVISYEHAERLILTRRHWALLDLTVSGRSPQVGDLLRAERTDRERVIKALVAELEAIERLVIPPNATLVLPDTNIFMHNEQYFYDVDWKLAAGYATAVHLVIPLAVVRELDNLKRSAKQEKISTTNLQTLRSRAMGTVRELQAWFEQPGATHALEQDDVTAELLLDPLRHQPIAHTDTEIIDRALAAQVLLGRQVVIATNDGGMQFSARTAGLGVLAVLD